MKDNLDFLQQNSDNSKTKICFLCGERHEFFTHKMGEAFFLVMTCPKEKVKLGGRTISPLTFNFMEKHILS